MELKLLKSTQDILELITEITQKPFSIIKKPDLPTTASIKIARKNMASHLLFYKDDKDGILDHLIAHECGHIYRIWGVPPEERKMAYSDDENKQHALSQIGDELLRLTNEIPMEKLSTIFDMWLYGITSQVTNIPVDIRIEKWIFDNYPQLRGSQISSIERQMKESAQVLSPRVKKNTPKKLYDASNYINYSFALSMESLIGKKYTAPYQNTPYTGLGSELANLVLKSEDRGFYQDIDIINQWTEMLSLKGWYKWRDFEDVPPDYLISQ